MIDRADYLHKGRYPHPLPADVAGNLSVLEDELVSVLLAPGFTDANVARRYVRGYLWRVVERVKP